MNNLINILRNPGNPIALFILYLIISGNYIGELLGCRLQETFSEIAYVKHIIAFLSLYYFVNLTTSEDLDPVKVLIKSAAMYSVFIISRNVSFGYTLIYLLCMIVIKFLEDYKTFHYKSVTEEEDNKNLEKIENIQQLLTGVIYLVIFVGFLRYTLEHRRNIKKWSWITYFLGPDIKGCKSLSDNATLKNVKWF